MSSSLSLHKIHCLLFFRFDVQDETVFTDILLLLLGYWTRRKTSVYQPNFGSMQKYHWWLFLPSKNPATLFTMYRPTIWFTGDFEQLGNLWYQTLGFISEPPDKAAEGCFEHHKIICVGHFFQPIECYWTRCFSFTKKKFNSFEFTIEFPEKHSWWSVYLTIID